MPKNNLSKRLMAAAEECREGSFIADVGTDHAYLPVYLARDGKIRGAVASDINEGPISRARANIAAAGLSDKISTLLCNGLSGVEKYRPNDIFILGMGGDLISQIIGREEFVRKKGTRLILQPMTHAEIVRSKLIALGFDIVKEKLVLEDKLYQIIVAEFVGWSPCYSQLEIILGKKNIEERPPLFPLLIEKVEKALSDRLNGRRMGGQSTDTEEELLRELEALKTK